MVATLGQALAGLATKINDAALLNKGAQALVYRMADKASDSRKVARLGQVLAGLATQVGPDQKPGLARLALHAQALRAFHKHSNDESTTLAMVFASVPVDELLIAMSTPMGAAHEGRETLLAALRMQAGLEDSDNYWAVIAALRRDRPKDFEKVSD